LSRQGKELRRGGIETCTLGPDDAPGRGTTIFGTFFRLWDRILGRCNVQYAAGSMPVAR